MSKFCAFCLIVMLALPAAAEESLPEFLKDYQPKRYPKMEEQFVYGVCMAWEQLREDAKLFDTTWQHIYRRFVDDMTRHYCNQVYMLSMDAHGVKVIDISPLS